MQETSTSQLISALSVRSINPGRFRALLTESGSFGYPGLADAFEVVVQLQTGSPASMSPKRGNTGHY
jgi:hypothetical protein